MAFTPNATLNRALGIDGTLQTQMWGEVASLKFTNSRVLSQFDLKVDHGHHGHLLWRFPGVELHSSASVGDMTMSARARSTSNHQRTDMSVRLSAPTSSTGAQCFGIGTTQHGCFLVYRQDAEGVNHLEVWLFRNYTKTVFTQADWIPLHLSQWRAKGSTPHDSVLRARFEVLWPHRCNVFLMDNSILAFRPILRLSSAPFKDGFVLYSRNLPAMVNVGQTAAAKGDVCITVYTITISQAVSSFKKHGDPHALHSVATITTKPTVALRIRNHPSSSAGIDTNWGSRKRLTNDAVVVPTTLCITPHKRNNVVFADVYRNMDLMWGGATKPAWVGVSADSSVSLIRDVFRTTVNLRPMMVTTASSGCTRCCLVLKSLPAIIRDPRCWSVTIFQGADASGASETVQIVNLSAHSSLSDAPATSSSPSPKKKAAPIVGEPVMVNVHRLSRLPEVGDRVEFHNGQLMFSQSTNEANLKMTLSRAGSQLLDGDTLTVVLRLLSGSMKVAVAANWEEI